MSTRTVHAQFKADGAIISPALHYCGECGALATHSTTDSQQTQTGWQETAKRHGCKEHKVTPNVILIDGTKMPFEQYQVQ